MIQTSSIAEISSIVPLCLGGQRSEVLRIRPLRPPKMRLNSVANVIKLLANQIFSLASAEALVLTKSELQKTFRGVLFCIICSDTVFLFGAGGVLASGVCVAFLFGIMMITAMIANGSWGIILNPAKKNQGLKSSLRTPSNTRTKIKIPLLLLIGYQHKLGCKTYCD